MTALPELWKQASAPTLSQGYITRSNPLLRLIYTSRLKPDFQTIEFIDGFVKVATTNNPKHGIGGRLFVSEDLERCEQILEGPQSLVERLFFGKKTYLKGRGGDEPVLLPREQWTGGIKGDDKHHIDMYRTWLLNPVKLGSESDSEEEEKGEEKEGGGKPGKCLKDSPIGRTRGISVEQSSAVEMESEKDRTYNLWGMSWKRVAETDADGGDCMMLSGKMWLEGTEGEDSGWKKFPLERDVQIYEADEIIVVEDGKPSLRGSVRRQRELLEPGFAEE